MKCAYAFIQLAQCLSSSFQAFAKEFQTSPDDLDMHVIYDVSHNIAKIEQHWVDNKMKTLLVHRKVILGAFDFLQIIEKSF